MLPPEKPLRILLEKQRPYNQPQKDLLRKWT